MQHEQLPYFIPVVFTFQLPRFNHVIIQIPSPLSPQRRRIYKSTFHGVLIRDRFSRGVKPERMVATRHRKPIAVPAFLYSTARRRKPKNRGETPREHM